jgi:hypothetical protein
MNIGFAFTSQSILKLKSHSSPSPQGRSRRIEGGMHDREISIYWGQRPGYEGALVGESRRTELRRGIVVVVKQVVDLCEDLQPLL